MGKTMLDSSIIFEISKENEVQNYIKENLFDPWVNTPFSGYRFMDNKQKGALGEMIVRLFFSKYGFPVKKAETSTSGHDLVIGDILTEVKFSLSHTDIQRKKTKEDCFTMNHVAIGKDWERLIFLGVNFDTSKVRCKFMTKDLFLEALNTGEYFSYQQGGKNTKNDDYIIASNKLVKLIKSRYMKDVSEW
jgi:hypothetical protein